MGGRAGWDGGMSEEVGSLGREDGDLECWEDVGNVGELEGLSIGGKGGSIGREGRYGWKLGEGKGLG